jgi:hypothetical protein
MTVNNSKYIALLTLVTLMSSAAKLSAQTNQSEQDTAVPPATSQQARQQPISPSEILRLEETIRGNKEQPQVLTIVPWQLPSHQRINENKAWQPMIEALPSIERGQFLRDLAVVSEISDGANDPGENRPASTAMATQ